MDPEELEILEQEESPATKKLNQEHETRVRNDFLFEWFQKFHASQEVLKTLYKFSRQDCMFNLRYLAMVMFFAAPEEFDPIIGGDEDGSYHNFTEEELR